VKPPPETFWTRPWGVIIPQVLGIGAVYAAIVGALVVAALSGSWLFGAIEISWSWEWWLGAYLVVGAIVGLLSAIAIFGGLWWWAANKYAFPGFCMGWLPSGIAGWVAGWLMVGLWGPVLLAWLAWSKLSTR
jgi:hypothetical protein